MKRHLVHPFVQGALALAATTLCAVPACSDSSNHPSLISTGGSAPAEAGRAGASTGDAGNAGNSAGGASAAGEAGAVGENAGDNSTGAAAGSGQPPIGPATCSPSSVWGDATSLLSDSSALSETLLSVTPDELDLAFLRADLLYVAHRSQASAQFAIGAPISLPVGWSAAQGAALSADGKRLILVSDPEHNKLGEISRASRSGAFSDTVDESAFVAVNQSALYTGKVYASPAVSPGDGQLFFNSAFPGAGSTVVVSTRTNGGPWPAPVQLTPQLLDGENAKRRLPTGVSADERTLFYFNEESANEEARWRATSQASSPLYDMLSLGKRRGAMPNTACNHLYSESDSDVVVEND